MLDPCSKGERLANRGCMQLFHLNILLIKYNLFLICSSGEQKRGSLNRMYCFTCQVLTRSRSADSAGWPHSCTSDWEETIKVNSVLFWSQNFPKALSSGMKIVFKSCHSTVYLVYSSVCKFAVYICCTLFLTSWWAKQFVSFTAVLII